MRTTPKYRIVVTSVKNSKAYAIKAIMQVTELDIDYARAFVSALPICFQVLFYGRDAEYFTEMLFSAEEAKAAIAILDPFLNIGIQSAERMIHPYGMLGGSMNWEKHFSRIDYTTHTPITL